MNRAPSILLAALPTLLLTGCGTDVSGPVPSLLSCVFGEPRALAQGEVLQVRGPANRTVCLAQDGTESGAYVYIPFFGTPAPGDDDPAVTLELELEALGGDAPAGGVSASLESGAPVLLGPGGGVAGGVVGPAYAQDHRFHDQLRRREIEELTPLIRGPAPSASVGARRAGGAMAVAVAVPQVGDLRAFNVAISCTDQDLRTGRVEHVSEHAVVVADTANPASMTPQDYAHFAVTFDTLVYPVETAHFGVPADIDDNGRVILFFTRAVNELTPRGRRGSMTIGFFWSGDLFPEQETSRLEACPAANQAEMFYLIAPDPNGVAGPEFTVSDVRNRAIPLIGHEFQHLINASRRLFMNNATAFEDPWLNEGLSHIAEELLFYAAADLSPLMNLGADEVRAAPNGVAAFNEYMAGNASNFRQYLTRPDTASLMGIDNLTTRGATWAFLRYAADRSGRGDEGFFFDLVNSRVAGLENLEGVLGGDPPIDWMRDWTVSVYADDFVPGIDARFTNASWDLRSIYAGTQQPDYALDIRTLSSGTRARVTLQAGGAVYTRFDVAAGGQAVVHVDAGGDPIPRTLRGSFLRVQ